MQILQQQFEGKPFRMIERDGQHWFVLADVCAALELTTPHKVAYRLDEDEKGRNLIPTPGGEQEMTAVAGAAKRRNSREAPSPCSGTCRTPQASLPPASATR